MNLKTRSFIKALIKRRAPWVSRWVVEPWLIGRYRRSMARLEQVERQVVNRYGLKVQAGPFEGLLYLPEAKNSGFAPKILGCYESEIAPAVASAIAGSYETIVDVGCAEGYFAVGFALKSPRSTVLAFDIDPDCRALCGKLAELNGVADRVIVGSRCDHAELHKIGARRVFLMSDCEGFEAELLDPAKAPAMIGWDLLVELHECASPGVTAVMAKRFEATHEITLFDSIRRNPDDFPQADFLRARRDRVQAVCDLRGSWQQWAFLRARNPIP